MKNTIFTFEKLYRAYLDCRKNKRKTINALDFEINLERNLFSLLKELQEGKYQPGRSICFVVKEPNPREIFAASFRDRVVHHLLVNEIEAIGEKIFIHDSYSCRKGKGTHKAVNRFKTFSRRITENYRKNAFYLQLDISGFFMAINKNILYSIVQKMTAKQEKPYQWKKDVLWLSRVIIFHNPTQNYVIKGNRSLFKLIPPRKSLFSNSFQKGLPIGNYSSQFFANLYLNELDQFIKRNLKCKNYLRYVDDLVILDIEKQQLACLIKPINNFLKKRLDVELNLSKTKLRFLKRGISFLGYFVKSGCSLVRQTVVKRFKKKIKELQNFSCGFLQLNIISKINSYYGHFQHANSFNLRKSIFENYLKALKLNIFPEPNYCFVNFYLSS